MKRTRSFIRFFRWRWLSISKKSSILWLLIQVSSRLLYIDTTLNFIRMFYRCKLWNISKSIFFIYIKLFNNNRRGSATPSVEKFRLPLQQLLGAGWKFGSSPNRCARPRLQGEIILRVVIQKGINTHCWNILLVHVVFVFTFNSLITFWSWN